MATKSKKQEEVKEDKEEFQPIITSITINPNGVIFGLCDNKIYVYDDLKKEWCLK